MTKEMNVFFPPIKNKAKMSILTTTIQPNVENSGQCNKARQGNESIQIRRKK